MNNPKIETATTQEIMRIFVRNRGEETKSGGSDFTIRQSFSECWKRGKYRYLLVCFDVFSKYTWVIPLKTKTGLFLVEAFKVILSSGRKTFNKHFQALMKEEDIN